ncbi:hypothetical protein H6S82_31810, partial [Planktothrix sp. FACHB-1355]|uniref:condensation domain-containing protein n=1 Tax=Planktothrix sp. FACHB-1355 TaxID=2692854 RepID=UPI0018EF5F24
AAENETQKKLVGIWEQVLAVEPVGLDDNFFILGGDSIKSLQIRALLKKNGFDVTLQSIFEFPTIRLLAAKIGDSKPASPIYESIPPFSLISAEDKNLVPENIVDAYPLTYIQSGMLFHSVFDSSSTAYHNVTSYHLNLAFSFEKLSAALNEVIDRHPVLRTSFDLSNFSEPLQLVHRQAPAKIDVEDLRGVENERQERIIKNWVENEKSNPFDLSEAGLIRFKIHLRTETTFQFSFSEHHAIVDGWSVATMITEIFKLYLDRLGINPAQLNPVPESTYRDFVAAERRALQSVETKEYWLKKIENRVATEIPRWSRKYRDPAYSGNRVKGVALSAATTRRLKEIASRLGVPIKSILLASHLFVLSVVCGQKDILSGLVSNGRLEENDSERVLGLFLNTLPFRFKFKSGSWTQLISEVFEQEKEILAHRWYPMAQLQKNSKTPLFETDFDFTHFHVYQSLEEFKGILLNHQGYEETNFTLTANFSLDLNAERVWLSLYYLPKKIGSEQITQIANFYLKTLEKIAEEPDGRYELFSPLGVVEREQIIERWNATAEDYREEGWLLGALSRRALV